MKSNSINSTSFRTLSVKTERFFRVIKPRRRKSKNKCKFLSEFCQYSETEKLRIKEKLIDFKINQLISMFTNQEIKIKMF
jgi:hypothetical protein